MSRVNSTWEQVVGIKQFVIGLLEKSDGSFVNSRAGDIGGVLSEGAVRSTTTPEKVETSYGVQEVDKQGSTFGNLSIAATRALTLEAAGASTTTGGLLPEGPCHGLVCETSTVLVFVELRERMRHILTDPASWTLGSGWAQVGSTPVVRHTSGTAVLSLAVQTLSSTVRPLLANVAYALKYTVQGRTAGSVTAAIGNSADSARSTNADFIVALKSTTTGLLQFTPSNDFDGDIDLSKIVIGEPQLLPNAGVERPLAAVRVLGVATQAAPTTLIASPATALVQAVWYRRPGAAEVT